MTREEAIERLKTDIYKYADFKENPNENEFWTAFDMAIKALEQEPILDKIRVEIEKLQTYKMFVGDEETYVERDDVLAIIDKHKGESGE